MRPASEAVVVRPAGARAVRNRHHWLFSGAVASLPEGPNGSVVPVMDRDGDLLGHAYFNRRCSLVARMIAFGAADPMSALRDRLAEAAALRGRLFEEVSGYRVVNGEADGMPGLVLDRYGDIAVMQIGTLGMDLLRDRLLRMIREICGPAAVYERSDSGSRREEGLKPRVGWAFGEPREYVDFEENDLVFRIRPERSQKTGFFLDQRGNRSLVRSLASGRRVLDCFSYTGGFSIAALKGGASQALLVDASGEALEDARLNLRLNGLEAASARADCFSFLREEPLDYDLVILDPPAFAKRKRDVVAACRGYKDINRLVMARTPADTLVLTCSCSYHVDAALFRKVVFQAAAEASRTVRILQTHRHAFDHPINLFHPETDYLKSLLLHVS